MKKTTIDSFVGRQLELDQLFRYLGDSLAGHGHVAFLSGEAGSGKTALLHQFACRALEAHGDLLVSGGTCSTYNGLGDPYQPFREVLKTLAGINDLACPGAIISSEPTMRLFHALPVILQTLLQASPDLVGTMIPAREFLQHARTATRLDTTMYTQLEALAMQQDSGRFVAALTDSQKVPTNYETNSLVQTCLFDQVSRMLLRLSQRFPLLIILDDLQWCDNASASLLFYLGSHLPVGRILLLGAYRPEDMISTGDGYRHPMIPVINEFQRRFGEIQIDLSLADGWAFVNSYLDHEPNHFDREFRKSFYLHTRGNALFTVELLDAMKERGEAIQDSGGYWISNPYVDWECLPARVEAVIAERLSRLDHECLALLEAASLQGEAFKPSALADVLGVTEGQIIAKLSGSLSRQHRLVSSLSPVQHDGPCQANYQFRHILFQKYLYQSLDGVERARLQKATAESLERNTTNN